MEPHQPADRTVPVSIAKSPTPVSPTVLVALVVAAMTACVLGLVVWKALDARASALAQGERDIRNLTHSLAEHASHSIQAVDVAMSGMVDILKYREPRADRFNLFLRNTVAALPQIREIAVLDTTGDWIYSSVAETPRHNNYDRSYFAAHRDSEDPSLRIGERLQSRLTGRQTIILSKRIADLEGNFSGVLVAAIDAEYFDTFYKTFNLGPHAGITLLRSDGRILAHWPLKQSNRDPTVSADFKSRLEQAATGYSRITSPFDGRLKYLGFERASLYPLVVTVALPEQEVLAGWHEDLRRDVAVGMILMCSVVLLAVLLSWQFRARARAEETLREREARYRLLADNSADVVVLLDRNGAFLFVSQSVEPMLGLKPTDLIGRSCFDFVHPDDLAAVTAATAELTDWRLTKTVVFKTRRADGSMAWVEINFKLAGANDDRQQVEVVGTLRDVTQRQKMEAELNALNERLAELATTDGLTGLANRRTFDAALRREYGHRATLSVIMIDIDNFKGFNDGLGHQAGDQCLKRVADVIAGATANTSAVSARYGGEEFAIILPDVTEQEALKVAEAVRLTVRSLAIANPASDRGLVSVSLGVASRTADTTDENRLVGDADIALYEAKHRGRNCSVLSSSAVQREAPALQPLANDPDLPATAPKTAH
jgi:diguanylate cyclase (GGDEF)-like protein/PAS domain S-box-containing protein